MCAQLGRHGILLAIGRRKYQHDRDWPDRFHSQCFEHCDRHQVYALWNVLETPETLFWRTIRIKILSSLKDAVNKVFVPFTPDFEFYHGRSPVAVEFTVRVPPKQTVAFIKKHGDISWINDIIALLSTPDLVSGFICRSFIVVSVFIAESVHFS